MPSRQVIGGSINSCPCFFGVKRSPFLIPDVSWIFLISYLFVRTESVKLALFSKQKQNIFDTLFRETKALFSCTKSNV